MKRFCQDSKFLLRCVLCVFFPFILDVKFVGCTSRGHYTGGRPHIFSHPPSFCGACLCYSREKDSAVPFPRRPRSRILCTNDFIVLHLLGMFIFIYFYLFSEEKSQLPGFKLTSQRDRRVTRLPTELPGRPATTVDCVIYTYLVYKLCLSRVVARVVQ